ncbi:MAG: organomercurial lyase [bacterium]
MPWDTAAVHHAIIDGFIEHGRPPRLSADAHPALLQLAADHGVVLHPGTTEVWIAHPFSASPTGVWVERRDDHRGWWAPCIWCAMGIVTLAAPDAVIHARYGGEAEPAVIEVVGGAARSDACIHFPIAARDAWANVVHWCASVLPFRSPGDVPAWCGRHALPQGDIVPIARVLDLGRTWYGNHRSPTWRKWTTAEAVQIFAGAGFTGPHWQLPAGDERF